MYSAKENEEEYREDPPSIDSLVEDLIKRIAAELRNTPFDELGDIAKYHGYKDLAQEFDSRIPLNYYD